MIMEVLNKSLLNYALLLRNQAGTFRSAVKFNYLQFNKKLIGNEMRPKIFRTDRGNLYLL